MNRVSDNDGPDLKLFILVGWDRSISSVAISTGAQLMILFCFRFTVVLFGSPGISTCHATRCVWWNRVFAIIVFNLAVVIHWRVRGLSCEPNNLKLFILVGWDQSISSVARSTGAQLMIFFCFSFPAMLFGSPGISTCHATRCVCWALVFASS